MPGLNCNANRCRHNINQRCSRNTINVGDCYSSGERKAECKSYQEGCCVVNNEFATEFACNPDQMCDTKINCESKDCIYNENEECHVSHVDIKESCDSTHNCAKCATYYKRK